MSKTQIGGHEIELKNLDKPFFPDADITKGKVVDDYRDLALTILPHLEHRPLTLQRFPDRIGEKGFCQQDRSDYLPDWIADVALERAQEGSEGPLRHVLFNIVATLVYLAKQGVITLHGWLSQTDRPKHPDSLIFDLDPPDDDFRCGALCRQAGG